MYQDRHGLLYISTYGGLSVYDGARFTNYTTDNGLSTNIVNDIVEMGNDSLWIVPNLPKLYWLIKGRLKEVITSDGFYPLINKMIRCSDGFYYALGDDGLFRFENNRFKKISLLDERGGNAGNFLVSAIEFKNKLLILSDFNVVPSAGPGRLIVYDFTNNHVTVSKSSLAYSLLLSPKRDLLVSTRQGLKKIDEKGLLENNIQLVSPPSAYKAAENVFANYMYVDQQQNFWLTTSQGVLKIDLDGRSTLFSVKNGLPVNTCTSVFQDRENTMWFVNGQTGISKLVNPQFEFYSQLKPGFTATDIYADKTTDSVWFLDAEHEKILLSYRDELKEFQLDQPPLSPPYKSITVSQNKIFLLDSYNVYQADFSSKNKIRLSVIHSDSSRNPDQKFNSLMPDRNGNLLILSEDLSILLHNNKSLSYPLGYFSDNFAITNDGQLWIATRGKKLFHFKINPATQDHYLQVLAVFNEELPKMSPRSITVDKTGNVWVGTRDHGLFCFYLNGQSLRSWKQFTTKDGLSNDFICYLYTDERNDIWACSPAGLDKIQLRDGEYFIENMTSRNNIYQYILKIQASKGNIHWALTGSGIIRIGSSETLQTSYQPEIIFRDIYEGRHRINTWSRQLSFSYNQNNINIALAAPSYLDEKQIRFSYLLEGSGNNSWSDPEAQEEIHLANLSPGEYTLRAKAIFVNTRYPNSEISYSFIISPPWWQTWWFKTLLLLTVFAILLFFVRYYYQGKLKNQRFELEKREVIKRERTRIATDMHDDLGAGLARIRFLSESIKRKKHVDSALFLPEISKISSFSDEMIEKMGEIVWALNEKNDSIADLIAFTRSYSVDYLQNHGIDYKVEVSTGSPLFFLSGETRRSIFLAVKEILFNIVKHANATEVIIRFSVSDQFQIDILDNGKGIDWEKIKPFRNGLDNIRKRIESINGRVEFINENGTHVKLIIPIDYSN
jgi:ligand-binding sensor domain-containing protein/signal transduction histidine kinase